MIFFTTIKSEQFILYELKKKAKSLLKELSVQYNIEYYSFCVVCLAHIGERL